jgi:uncharacterized protein YcbX
MDEVVGRVSALWRFPVKSMQGEQLSTADVTADGIPGDRAYALVDVESGKVISAKSARLFPNLLSCRAAFATAEVTGAEPPPVVITLGDGATVRSDDADCDDALSRFFGRKVRLSRAAPSDFTIDQYHPDIDGADPSGHRDAVVETQLGAAFFAGIGAPSPVAAGAFFDLFPLSLITTSTLDRLGELAPGTNFDVRRFRMNIVVDTDANGFVENEWVGRMVSIEGGTTLRIAMPDPRCVMTTLAQGDDLPAEATVLRTLIKNNRLEVVEGARYPCAGVYAVLESPGTVESGASVSLS